MFLLNEWAREGLLFFSCRFMMSSLAGTLLRMLVVLYRADSRLAPSQ